MNTYQKDILIIGAGACGASLAFEASKRGLDVGLIDAKDIGSGTSSKSTKLLHGGVRYLELAFKKFDLSQLKLVEEALNERKYWINKIPFLAKRIDIAIPTTNFINNNYYKLGMNIYDRLSGKNNLKSSYALGNAEIQQKFHDISPKFTGGIIYSDGMFNDCRLNLTLALTAEKLGAKIKNYCKLIGFEKDNEGKIIAALTRDINGCEEKWVAKVFVNATGIYSDEIRKLSTNQILNERILISKGTHIVLDKDLCSSGNGLLIPKTKDGRVLFVLPYFGNTLVGTTDQICEIAEVNNPLKEEKRYLLNSLKEYFSNIEESNICSIWSGGRPLIKSNKEKLTRNIVREHEIEILNNGLVSILGGKWTTCRKIALDALFEIQKLIGIELNEINNQPLLGSTNDFETTCNGLKKERIYLQKALSQNYASIKQIDHLQSNYGLQASKVIKNATKNQLIPLSHEIPFCEAEIRYSIINEHTKNVEDFLQRRIQLTKVNTIESEKLKIKVKNIFQKYAKFK